jgi:hypothetical protein
MRIYQNHYSKNDLKNLDDKNGDNKKYNNKNYRKNYDWKYENKNDLTFFIFEIVLYYFVILLFLL